MINIDIPYIIIHAVSNQSSHVSPGVIVVGL